MVIHFGSLLFYAKPFYTPKTKFDFYAQAYVYPYFHQSWNLFVPVPESNYRLYCQYENNGKQLSDIFSEIRIKHQTNRLRGYEPVLIAFANSFHYFEKNTLKQQALNGPISDDLNFKIIELAAKNYIEYSRKIKIQNLKLILVVEQTLTQKQRVYFN